LDRDTDCQIVIYYCFAVPAIGQQEGTVNARIIAPLAALDQEYEEAFNNGDAIAMAATFTEDSVLVSDTGPIYGREAIGKYYEALFEQIRFSDHICKSDQSSPRIIGTTGNEAWSNREWSATIQGQNFGPYAQRAMFHRLLFVRVMFGKSGCRFQT
jgi:ketosteroid isomerase-like protein